MEKEANGFEEGDDKARGGQRERERAPFLPSMPVLGHVKYANCGYAEALLVLVLPSTNYISFGRVYVCSPRPMGTRRIPRVYAPCPKTVHTVKYTRAPTLLSLSLLVDTAFSSLDARPSAFCCTCCDFAAVNARPDLSRCIYTNVALNATHTIREIFFLFLPSCFFPSPPSLSIRELSNRSLLVIGPRWPKNPSRPISPIHRAAMRVLLPPPSSLHSNEAQQPAGRPVGRFVAQKFPGFP